jgi:presenilin-like A22 family membrane protease
MLSWVHPAWVGFELPTLVVIGTDCIGSCKSNYHTIMTMMTQCYRYMYTCTSSWSKESEYVLFQLQIYWTISLYCSRVMPLLYTSFYNTDDCVALVVEVLQIYSSSWSNESKIFLFQLQIYWHISLYCSRVMSLLYTSLYNTDVYVPIVVEVPQIHSSCYKESENCCILKHFSVLF